MLHGKSPPIQWRIPTTLCCQKRLSAGQSVCSANCYRVLSILFSKSTPDFYSRFLTAGLVMLSVSAECLLLKKAPSLRYVWHIWLSLAVFQSTVLQRCIPICSKRVCSVSSASCGPRSLITRPTVLHHAAGLLPVTPSCVSC